nr:hypothetical protein [Tanacetum cinerariifolium]
MLQVKMFEDILGVTTNTGDTNGVEADLGNMEYNISASPTPTFRIHKDHPKSQITGPVNTPVQTRHKSKEMEEQKPKKISDTLKDPSWVEAMHEELLQFKIQNVWIFVDCPKGVRPIRTKWVLKNNKDERGIVIRNKSRLVAQGHTQEEEIDYKEVFAPVARIEAIRLFLAYASFMGFTVYQMDVKSAFLYGTINEEVYVMQPPGFHDPEFPNRVYKVEKAMYGLHQAPRAWYVYVDDIIFRSSNPQLCREFEALMHEKFQMSAMGELNFFLGLQVLQKKDGIFLSQDKYVGDILKKFRYSDVSDYGGASQDRKSTTEGCQFLGRRLISWQCKKQTSVATSTTEAEYVAAASGCGQVLLAFYDYHNMIAILEKSKHNVDFHQIVDFVEASHIRIETANEGTKILTTIDADAPEISGNSNSTATSTNPPADQTKALTVATPIPTEEPKNISDALKDPSWVEATQEELFQFKIQNVWSLVDCPEGDPEFSARVYKVEKAMGTIDQTLFIRKHRGDFILVQVYVDDIIFGSSNLQLCKEFEAIMHEKFQMSAMGELNFFLGLQVLQKKDGIFLSQD